MTDKKEIIIDGVDVSECDFLWKEKLPKKVCNNGNLDCNCNSNPNCRFKQLKRKEQECEELNSDNRHFVNQIISLELLTDKYEIALDEIEKIISTPCISTINSCIECKCSSCLCKQVLNIINEAKEA